MADSQNRRPRSRRPRAKPDGNPFQNQKQTSNSRGVVTDVQQIVGLGRPGFQNRSYPRPRDSKYLLQPPPSFFYLEEKVDPWDAANQAKLLQLENQIGTSPGAIKDLVTKFQQMREDERREMESRGLVDRLDTRKALSDAIVFIGTCQTMCPIFERVRRIYENDIKALEREPDGSVTARRAVKAFSRPAAGQPPALPSDVRPPRVLMETLGYLVQEIVPQLPKSQSFLWDRTRSIRQDFTYQHYVGPEAVICNEVIVRIHLLTLHIMAGDPGDYSSQQEIEQLNKALQTLDHLYKESQKNGIENPNEPEFRAYQLLSHLRDPEMDYMVTTLPPHVAQHPFVLLALELRALAASGTRQALIASFFKRVRSPDVPVLFQCLAETHFVSIRLAGIQALYRSLHHRTLRKYSLQRFEELLGFDQGGSEAFRSYYDLKTEGEFVLLEGFKEPESKKAMAQPCEKFISERLSFDVLAFPGVQARKVGPTDYEIRQFIDKLIAKEPIRQIVIQEHQKALKLKLQQKRDLEKAKAEAERQQAVAQAERAAAAKADAERSAQQAAAAKEEAERAAAARKAENERAMAMAAAHQLRKKQRDTFVSQVASNTLDLLLAAVQESTHYDISLLARAERLYRRSLAKKTLKMLRKEATSVVSRKRRLQEALEAEAMIRQTRPRRVRQNQPTTIDETHLSQLFRSRSRTSSTPPSPAVVEEPPKPIRPPSPLLFKPKKPVKRTVDVLDVPSLRLKRPTNERPVERPLQRPRVPAVPKAIQNLRNLISSALKDV